MKKAELPVCFTTLKRGKVTLYIKKEYEQVLSAQDIDKLFDLCQDANASRYNHHQSLLPKGMSEEIPSGAIWQSGSDNLNVSYHGRNPCKIVAMQSINDESFVVREYWHGGLFGKILRDFFWDSMRPVKELSMCEIVGQSGIKTAEVVAIVRNRVIGPIYKCRLVSKEIKNSIDLLELLRHPERRQLLLKKRQIISKMAAAIKGMHDAGVYHADLHLKNILVQLTEGGPPSVYIIDLDKSRQYQTLDFSTRMKNIMRLDRSLEKFKRQVSGIENLLITNTDRVRFLKEYLSYKSVSDSCASPRDILRSCIRNYQTAHKSHRFWWLFVER